ncbi:MULTISPECIES: hypothetical protein [Streptomyces]|uniref:hypothetical protein n=1 Tax=Streptomyces TaxID=1883 RepID=UPI00068BB62B|nr:MULTISPECIES: hypothetical protein [Streptomyces]
MATFPTRFPVPDTHGMRLLPWSGPEGKPCYLSTDDPEGVISLFANEVEKTQLDNAQNVLRHARSLLSEQNVTAIELRFTVQRTTECLHDVLRIAHSRQHPAQHEGTAHPSPTEE